MKALGAVGASVLALVVTCALAFGGWEAGWWFTNQNVNRQSHVLRNSYANQQTLRDQITQNIGTVLAITSQIAEDPGAGAALKAQRAAVVAIVCGDAAQVVGDPLNSEQAGFIAANCLAGSVSPTSQYNVN